MGGEEGSGKGGREEERGQGEKGEDFFLLSITFFLLNLLIVKCHTLKILCI